MPELLFIYGTLHPGRAPAEIAPVVHTLTPLGPATIRGTLLDLGDYPGVTLNPEAPEVPGDLFAIPDPTIWTALDAYEDFRPAEPAASLFLRTQTLATLPDGSQTLCWIYTHNRP